MKIIRMLLITIVGTTLVTSVAFTQFEFGVSIPLGFGIGMSSIKYSDAVNNNSKRKAELDADHNLKTSVGFEWGVSIQPGYFVRLGKKMGISILSDLGYQKDVFIYKTAKISGIDSHTSFRFDTIGLGLLPKFNIGNIAIGLGLGVRFPLNRINTYNPRAIGRREPKPGKLLTQGSYKPVEILKYTYKKLILPYIKLTFDYSIFIGTKTAVTVGLYAGYDFGMQYSLYDKKSPKIDFGLDSSVFKKYAFSSVDVGAQIGLKFGPNPSKQ